MTGLLSKDEEDTDNPSNYHPDTIRTRCKKGDRTRPKKLDLREVSWAGEDLTDLDLSGYDLSNADLSGADLSRSNLSRCRFAGSNLFKAALVDSEFLRSDMTSANLGEVTANRAGLDAVDLTGASLVGAELVDAALNGATLVHADFRTANLCGAGVRDANLENAVFTRAKLENADLKYSNVKKTDFHVADLSNARLLGLKNYDTANWVGADISGADHRGAFMILRHIRDDNYLYEFKSRSRYHAALFWVWRLTSNCGRSLTRWAISITTLSLLFACLYSFVDIDYGDYETPFSAVYYSVVTLTTLGYGDAVPASMGAQVIAIIEALLGYIGLGGLLSILSNKMARRAD